MTGTLCINFMRFQQIMHKHSTTVIYYHERAPLIC